MDAAATEFLTFMDNLYVKYPEFVDRPLYMTGESYGGKYLPAFSKKLLEANAERGNRVFDLMATLIGDPYTAPLTQRTNIYKVPEALFTLDDMNLSQVSALNRHCQEAMNVNNGSTDAGDKCAAVLEYFDKVSGGVFPYNNMIFSYDWDAYEKATDDYFDSTKNTEWDTFL